MYPRNAASPERISIGPVILIADGTVQTSGVSVKVLPQGTTASAGGGTIAYEEGVVHYTPTQAETNYTSFILIAYKTGCIPATTTVVTSASAVAGYAGLDWAAIRAPTTTVALSGTTVGTVTTLTGHTAQTGDAFARLGAPAGASVSADIAAVKTQTAAIETDTQDIQSRLPAALVSGRMDSSVGAMAANTLTASALATDAVTEIQAGLASQTSVDTLAGYVDTEVAAIKAKTDNLPASPAATGDIPSAATIADAVWDEALSGHLSAGSTGNALNAAGAAGDPWSTALPGAYGAGTAGKIIGDNLNATVSSRASQTSVDTIDGIVDSILVDTAEIGAAGAGLTALASAANLATVDTVVDAIKAKTDSLNFTVAGSVDANVQQINDVTITGDGQPGTEFGVT